MVHSVPTVARMNVKLQQLFVGHPLQCQFHQTVMGIHKRHVANCPSGIILGTPFDSTQGVTTAVTVVRVILKGKHCIDHDLAVLGDFARQFQRPHGWHALVVGLLLLLAFRGARYCLTFAVMGWFFDPALVVVVIIIITVAGFPSTQISVCRLSVAQPQAQARRIHLQLHHRQNSVQQVLLLSLSLSLLLWRKGCRFSSGR
mmetsp:Transcript_8918/g.20158  ORF Transcript_8918/g.20158 Transcript_8918/m.20158 type:complete len:201 (-) Transcript_8918:130-732(-)